VKKIFSGHCFDENQNPLKKGLFCPFAHRLPPPEIASLAKDLANEYHYLGNTSEWFFLARKNAEKVIAKNEQYIKGKKLKHFHLIVVWNKLNGLLSSIYIYHTSSRVYGMYPHKQRFEKKWQSQNNSSSIYILPNMYEIPIFL